MTNEHGAKLSSDEPGLWQLLQLATGAARAALEEQGGFLPCSIARDRDGQYHLAVATGGGTDGSNELVAALRAQAAGGALAAAALYRDVRVRPAGQPRDADAIHVVLEDAAGHALHAFQVYRKGAGGGYVYEPVAVESAPPSIFLGAPAPRARPNKWWQFWK